MSTRKTAPAKAGTARTEATGTGTAKAATAEIVRTETGAAEPSGALVGIDLGASELLWDAKYLASSDFLAHIPALFLLTVRGRPANVLTLGFDDGVAHFAICQAAERAGGDFFARAIRLRAQDAEGAGADTPTPAAAYNAEQYGEISRLDSATLAEAPDLVEDASVDLLVVETGAAAEIVPTLEDTWFAKLRPGGAVVFVISSPDEGEAAAELARAKRGLIEAHPHLVFEHDTGLAVILPGEGWPDDVEALRRDLADPKTALRLDTAFDRLGRRFRLTVENRTLARGGSDDQLRAAAAEQARSLQEELDELREAYDARHAATAAIQAQLFDAEQRAADQARRLEETYATIAMLEDRVGQLDAEVNTQIAAVAAVTQTAEKQFEQMSRKAEDLSDQAARAQRERDAHARKIDEYLSSTSWKVSRPIRVAGTLAKKILRRG